VITVAEIRVFAYDGLADTSAAFWSALFDASAEAVGVDAGGYTMWVISPPGGPRIRVGAALSAEVSVLCLIVTVPSIDAVVQRMRAAGINTELRDVVHDPGTGSCVYLREAE
jgi:hypothetical protein